MDTISLHEHLIKVDQENTFFNTQGHLTVTPQNKHGYKIGQINSHLPSAGLFLLSDVVLGHVNSFF